MKGESKSWSSFYFFPQWESCLRDAPKANTRPAFIWKFSWPSLTLLSTRRRLCWLSRRRLHVFQRGQDTIDGKHGGEADQFNQLNVNMVNIPFPRTDKNRKKWGPEQQYEQREDDTANSRLSSLAISSSRSARMFFGNAWSSGLCRCARSAAVPQELMWKLNVKNKIWKNIVLMQLQLCSGDALPNCRIWRPFFRCETRYKVSLCGVEGL